MSIIARTAGIGRSVEELQWDLNYLLQLWTAIDGAAKDNSAPILIYLESSLVIRAIRDYFSQEIGEILIDTDDIYEQATAFMSVVMPDNVQRVKMYRDDIPLFSRFQIENQIETAYSRTVQLPSGGAVVIDHTEALVAIDVNSARSTRGADIEETAVRTNLEAADEVARQLRLRDLGGLIVIDFIDMEDGKNQRAVEQRLRDALYVDRARVQMGKISRFGLMELSRQRLRPALNEGSHITCPRCTGTGVIRDAESSALHVLRLLQEEAMKEGTAALHAQVPVDVATYLLNEKRADVSKIESRLNINLTLIPNKNLETPHHIIERLRHDDARLDEVKTSFQQVQEEAPSTLTPHRTHEVKARPEALVKGITPSQPAPTAASVAKVADKPSLWKRIMAWFSPTEEAPKPEQKKTSATKPHHRRRTRNTSEQNAAGSGERSNRQRRGQRPTAGAEDATEQPQTKGTPTGRNRRRPAQNTADTTPSAENRQARATTAGAEGADAAETSTTPSSNRRRRGGRGRRREPNNTENTSANHEENTDVNAAKLAATAATATPAAQSEKHNDDSVESKALENDSVVATDESQTQGDPERRRRRRRSRRGRRSPEAAATNVDQNDNADAAEAANAETTFVAHQTPSFDAAAFEKHEDVKASTPESTEGEAVTVIPTASETTAPKATIEPEAAIVEKADLIDSKASEVVTQPVEEAAVAAPSPAVESTKSVNSASQALDQLLAQSSLQVVETRTDAKSDLDAYRAPVASSERPTRTRQKVVIENVPLVQIETQNEASSSAERAIEQPLVTSEAEDNTATIDSTPERVDDATSSPEAVEASTPAIEQTHEEVSEPVVAEDTTLDTAPEISVDLTTTEDVVTGDTANGTNDETAPAPALMASESTDILSDELKSVLEQRGLALVETSTSANNDYYQAPKAKLGRPRKTAVSVEPEALELVETK